MVRNFKQMNGCPRNPIRSCRKRTGPRERHLMTSAIEIERGTNAGEARTTNEISSRRFHRGLTIVVVCGKITAAGITVVVRFTLTAGRGIFSMGKFRWFVKALRIGWTLAERSRLPNLVGF